MESVWDGSFDKNKFKSLNGDINTDVLIIGGGMCGILCARLLKEAGVDYVLVEADRICSGITKGTTAKITFQHGLVYHKIIKKYGLERTAGYFESQKKALEKFKTLAEKVDCDFRECDSFVYSLADKSVIEEELLTLEKIGCKAELSDQAELPFQVEGAVKVCSQAALNPIKFAFGISKDLNIYENTKVIELKPDLAITNRGVIRASRIIVATHFPFINKHGGYFMKMYQHRSYVIGLKNAANIKDLYVDEANDGLSFRMYGDILLLGGGSHRTGGKGGNWAELERVARKYYPDSSEVCRWATQDCITLDSIPYIGEYSKSVRDLYVATGFNKWGMTSSMVSAMILCDMLQGKRNEYSDVYSPSRTVFHPQLAVNIFESLKGLLTPTAPRCPHMGCALKYNKQEHSWDCPCHGSRFEKDGRLINNPATDDKIK